KIFQRYRPSVLRIFCPLASIMCFHPSFQIVGPARIQRAVRTSDNISKIHDSESFLIYVKAAAVLCSPKDHSRPVIYKKQSMKKCTLPGNLPLYQPQKTTVK